MKEIDRHKVFISYYHTEDQGFKNFLINSNYKYNLFEDWSVNDGDIDDTGLSDEQIRIKIRDEFMRESTVLILLCGKNTKRRKHIDWEIHTAMFNTEKNPKMGILVVNLPDTNPTVRALSDEEKDIIFDNSNNFLELSTRNDYENAYPYMPSRIIDNLVKKVPIAVVDWATIETNLSNLKTLVDEAFKKRKTNQYDHSTPLRRNNS